jgi:hypothetical protein
LLRLTFCQLEPAVRAKLLTRRLAPQQLLQVVSVPVLDFL